MEIQQKRMKMGENSKYVLLMVVLLYPDIKFLNDFLDELGNFKQKKFTLLNVIFFYILQQWTLYVILKFPALDERKIALSFFTLLLYIPW